MDENSFKYLHVIQHIENMVNKGEIDPFCKLATENDLALRLGVSRITIQKAFSEMENEGYIYKIRGKGTFVSQNTQNTDNDSKGNIRFVGIVFPSDSTMQANYGIVEGVQSYVKNRDCYVTVHNSNGSYEQEESIIHNLIEDGAFGIILQCINQEKNFKLYRHLMQKKFPLVFLDNFPHHMNVDFVSVDNFMGAYRAVSYLISLGHRRIAFISDEDMRTYTAGNRFKGYCTTLKDHTLPVDRDLVKLSEKAGLLSASIYEQFIDELLQLDKVPTAIFAMNDNLDLGCINKLIKSNINVPSDLSVIGFDNIPNLEHHMVLLTTVEQKFHLI